MTDHGEEGSTTVYYQRGLLVTSLIILVYVFGDGSIKPELSIAVIGLTLKQPVVIEYALGAIWAWYLWRFIASNEFNFRDRVRSLAAATLNNSDPATANTRAALANLLQTKGLTASEHDILLVTSVGSLITWKISRIDPIGGKDEQSISLRPYECLWWRVCVIGQCLASDSEFADKYLPLGIAIAAGAFGAYHIVAG